MKRFFNKKTLLVAFLLVFTALSLTSCNSDTSAVSNWKGMTWFGKILVYPIMWLMHGIGSGMGDSYFWGLLFTTLIIRTLAWPIYASTNSYSMKMSLAQPEINRIQQKYAGRKDPESQQRMQQETLKVYKKYKINPLGCLTVFIQMPIFIAVYQAVVRINKAVVAPALANGVRYATTVPGKFYLSNTKVLGLELEYSLLTDRFSDWKSAVFAIVLAALVGFSMWLSQKVAQKKPSYSKNIPTKPTSSKEMDTQRQMKMMSNFMIIMMVFMSLSSNSLALYWVIGTFYSIGQSIIGRKINERNYYKLEEKNNLFYGGKNE